MTGFLAMTFVMVCLVLAFVLPPLLRRPHRAALVAEGGSAELAALYRQQMAEVDADLSSGLLAEKHRQEAKHELERRLLGDWPQAGTAQGAFWQRSPGAALGMLVLLPLGAALLYAKLGNPGALSAPQPPVAPAHAGAHGATEDQIARMVETLARKLEQAPDNPEGWAMLARSYEVLRRYPESAAAFEMLIARIPDDAALLADYADVLAMMHNGRLAGKPMQLVRRALRADPLNAKALALAGTDAFDRKEYRRAAAHWTLALRSAPPDSEFAASLRASLAEANALLALPSGSRSAQSPALVEPNAGVAASVSGTVRIADRLRDRVPPEGVLFLFARAENGPRMPLAILRASANALPMTFVLDDRSSMSPERNLSGAKRVIVSARISRTGDATPTPGDLTGSSAVVNVGARGIEIEINDTVK